MTTTSDPHTPYAGTSGWSGSEASRERAIDHDRDGTTSKRQRDVVALVERQEYAGMTWREVAAHLGLHHGQATSVLSVLHKEGVLERLTERRARCSVYVHPDYVDGRETAPHGRHKPVEVREAMTRLRQDLDSDGGNVTLVWSDALETVLDYLERKR